MSAKNLFGKIWDAISGIFKNSVENIWDDLSPEEQENLKKGSGIVAIFNEHIDDVPEAIIEGIQETFPDFDLSNLETILSKVCSILNIDSPSLINAIISIQNWLNSKDGVQREWASSSLAELITILIGGGDSIAKISMLIEFVYRKFFKK